MLPRRGIYCRLLLLLLLLLLGLPTGAAGGDEPAARPALAPVREAENWRALADPRLRTEPLDRLKYLPLGGGAFVTLGGDLRVMHENFRDEDWGLGAEQVSHVLLVRMLAHADLRWGDRARLFGQLGSSHEQGRAVRRPNDVATFYLNAGFLELGSGDPRRGRLEARLGRMELLYGEGRLISFRGRPNVRRSHDGGRLRWQQGPHRLDALLVWDVRHADHSPRSLRLDDQRLAGLYLQRALGRGHALDLYLLATDRPQQTFDLARDDGQSVRLVGPERRRSLGARWQLRRGAWRSDLEVTWQWGTFAPRDEAAALDIRALGLGSRTRLGRPGRAIDEIGLELTWNTGDSDAHDTRLNTFRGPLPSGSFFGGGHELSHGNLVLLRPHARWRPHRTLAVQGAVFLFGRVTVADGSYAMPGRAFLPAADSRRTGWMPELVVTRQASPQAVLQLEVTWFDPGPYLAQVTPGRSILFVCPSVTLRF
jgi:hypothetical protein